METGEAEMEREEERNGGMECLDVMETEGERMEREGEIAYTHRALRAKREV